MSTIFVSYRREDAAGWAGHLTSDLRRHFGAASIFHDLETIDPGEDFALRITRALETCRVAIVMIGPEWVAISGENGLRRLETKDDFVRVEVGVALRRPNVRVIPVLVGGATVPTAQELPADLQPLLQRQAFEISDERWDHDVERLIASIGKLVGGSDRSPVFSRLLRRSALAVSALVLAAVATAWLVTGRGSNESPSSSAAPARDVSAATASAAAGPQGPVARAVDARPPSEPGTLAIGKGVVVARGSSVPGCALAEPRIDARSVTGTLRIDLATGAGPSGASFELYREGDQSYRDSPNAGHLTHIYNVGPNDRVTMRYNFEQGQVFRLCAAGNWFSPIGATNTYTFRAWIEPLAAFPKP